eukprot:gene2341-4552_t
MFALDLSSGTVRLLSAPPCPSVLKRYHNVDIKCTTVVSSDGCPVPLTVFSPRLSPSDYSDDDDDNYYYDDDGNPRPRPTLLAVYGAYGVSFPMSYRPQVMLLLKKGWNFAVAHTRGGGELGHHWHCTGKGLLKKNSFADYLACAEYLIKEGYTSSNQLCGEGHSAGGLVCGAAANERPELFAGFILRNPFLDPLGAMLDPSERLSVHEYDEWGSPQEEEDLQNVRSYSPLQNIPETGTLQSKTCPAFFVSVGMQDVRVSARESFDWAARLRESRRSQTKRERMRRPILLNIHEDAGHEGPRSVEEQLTEDAMEIVFLDHVTAIHD